MLVTSLGYRLPSTVMEGYTILPCHPCDRSALLTVYILMTWTGSEKSTLWLVGLLGMELMELMCFRCILNVYEIQDGPLQDPYLQDQSKVFHELWTLMRTIRHEPSVVDSTKKDKVQIKVKSIRRSVYLFHKGLRFLLFHVGFTVPTRNTWKKIFYNIVSSLAFFQKWFALEFYVQTASSTFPINLSSTKPIMQWDVSIVG